MRRYDPARKPDPKAWLALAEDARIRLALEHHRRVRTRVPNIKMHAVIHAVVENQIALGDDYAVERTVQRLMDEGLDRHEAIHAVGSVLIGHLGRLTGEAPPADPNAAYLAAVQDLTAESWRDSAKR